MLSFETILTTCTYCGCGCGFLLEVLDGEVVGTLPQKDHPVSQGKLCIKGWNAHEFIHDQGRLKEAPPEKRRLPRGSFLGGGPGRGCVPPPKNQGMNSGS